MTATEAAQHYHEMRRCAGMADFRTADVQKYLTACSAALEALWAAQRAERVDETREVGN